MCHSEHTFKIKLLCLLKVNTHLMYDTNAQHAAHLCFVSDTTRCFMCGALTEGCSHGWMLHGGLTVSGGQVRSGEVAALFVVVFDIEAGEFGEADSQSAAAIIDVLSIQRLKHTSVVEVVVGGGGYT